MTWADEVLERILEIIRLQRDRPLVCLARWVEDDLVMLGDPLPRELCEESRAPGSPWDRAWKGEPSRGTADELPTDLREVAAEHGVQAFWIRPVQRGGHDVEAVITVWYPTTGRSLLAWELTIDFMIDAASVAIAFQDQRMHRPPHRLSLLGEQSRDRVPRPPRGDHGPSAGGVSAGVR